MIDENTGLPLNEDGSVRWMKETPNKPLKICLALPNQNWVSTGIAQLMFELKDACKAHGMADPDVILRGDRPHDYCRNLIAQDFLLNSEAEWLLSVDADMIPPTDALLSMVKDADASGIKLVSAHCNGTLKGVPTSVGFIRAGGTEEMPHWSRIEVCGPGRIEKVDAFGTGCYAVKREVFQVLPMPWYRFQYTDTGLVRTMGEDVFFTYSAKKAGIQPFYDSRIRVPHMKELFI